MNLPCTPRARLAAAALLAFALGACGSDPLTGADDPNDEDDGASAGENGGGTGGTASQPGGKGGSAGAPVVPDYSTSPCYGEVATTERYDGMTHQQTRVVATCRAESERTLLYVEDALFGSLITQEAVNRFVYRFEQQGNANSHRPDLGVLPTNELVFGALAPAEFPNGKLPVFVIDSKGGGDGYLCGWCARLELHLDGTELAPLDGDQALGIAAHESFHAIHRGYDARELPWVDETLAEAAMVVNGFSDGVWLQSLLNQPNVNWGPSIEAFTDFHYGMGFVFGAYLWEQGGPELMAAITHNRSTGWRGIDAALSATGSTRDGLTMFLDMGVALYADEPEGAYGFEALDFGDKLRTIGLTRGMTQSGKVQPYGLVYLVPPEGTASLSVDGGASLLARVAVSGDELEVRDVELGAPVALGDAHTVLVLTATASATYSVTAE
jgi:hypothetical protein